MAVEAVRAGAARSWQRSYPPLALMAVAVLIAAVVLPSRLNLPQSNPSTVLEYAPVPPEDVDDSPPGNVSSLGLGSSNTLSLGGKPPPPPPPPPDLDQGAGTVLSNKKCVGDPPRQTEDPMSPPCVPYFDGDNFGATYQGVTGDEIKVILYFDNGCPNRECAKPSGTFEDLESPPKPPCPQTWPQGNPTARDCDYIWVRVARGMAKFFNDRFQIYKRKVHYYAYVTSANTDATRRADAANLWSQEKPFAIIDFATYNGHNEAFVETVAQRGVVVFSSRQPLPNAFYAKGEPNVWGFWPDVEHWAAQYSSYVCQKVDKHPVKHSGNGQTGSMNGRPRTFGLYYTTDKGDPGLLLFKDLVKSQLKACGVTWAAEGTFPYSNFGIKAGDAGADQQRAVAQFKSKGVTTVLWLGGVERQFSNFAAKDDYYPEIVVAGDLRNDNNQIGRLQDQTVWQNAWATHFMLRLDRSEDSYGYRAYKEGNPRGTTDEARFANEMYPDHFMLFQAIQVAGPKLSPRTIDKGYHAIPTHTSTSPYIASCFFDPGDYTCVKDSSEVWWDPTGQAPTGTDLGCYRLVREGRRFLAGRWDGGDDVFNRAAGDPCTGFEGRYQIDPS